MSGAMTCTSSDLAQTGAALAPVPPAGLLEWIAPSFILPLVMRKNVIAGLTMCAAAVAGSAAAGNLFDMQKRQSPPLVFDADDSRGRSADRSRASRSRNRENSGSALMQSSGASDGVQAGAAGDGRSGHAADRPTDPAPQPRISPDR